MTTEVTKLATTDNTRVTCKIDTDGNSKCRVDPNAEITVKDDPPGGTPFGGKKSRRRKIKKRKATKKRKPRRNRKHRKSSKKRR